MGISQLTTSKYASWQELSRPLASLPEERLPGSSWPPRQLGSLPPPPEESRSPTDTGPAQSPSGRSEDTRSPPNFSSASCPSSVWSGKSPRTSRLTSASRAPPSWLFRRRLKPTLLVCSRTPTCVPSTPRGSPSCPRTSSSPGGSVERGPRLRLSGHQRTQVLQYNQPVFIYDHYLMSNLTNITCKSIN